MRTWRAHVPYNVKSEFTLSVRVREISVHPCTEQTRAKILVNDVMTWEWLRKIKLRKVRVSKRECSLWQIGLYRKVIPNGKQLKTKNTLLCLHLRFFLLPSSPHIQGLTRNDCSVLCGLLKHQFQERLRISEEIHPLAKKKNMFKQIETLRTRATWKIWQTCLLVRECTLHIWALCATWRRRLSLYKLDHEI